MNYELCLDFLYKRLPMFQQHGKKALKYDLSNITRLCEHFQNPQNRFKSIHIAGTNGKGSVSHQMASILQCAGYRVGLYTSPHLVDFRERIRINGQMIAPTFVVDFVGNHMDLWEEVKPTFFELTTLLAFVYFEKNNVDYAVIETGLGGRLDSTNVIEPLISVITNISFDHTDILGTTLEAIAAEKAGIIKPHKPVVIGEKQRKTYPVFVEKANEVSASITFAEELYEARILGGDFNFLKFQIISKMSNQVCFTGTSDLLGEYQQKNIVTSYCAIEILRKNGVTIPDEALIEGYSSVKSRTGLMGRWQIIQTNPIVICDTGHNPSGMEQVVKQLSYFKSKRLHVILGFSADKDVEGMLQIVASGLKGHEVCYYYTQSSVKRSLDSHKLAHKAELMGIKGKLFETVVEAFNAAKVASSVDDVIFIGGSNFVVGDFLKYFND